MKQNISEVNTRNTHTHTHTRIYIQTYMILNKRVPIIKHANNSNNGAVFESQLNRYALQYNNIERILNKLLVFGVGYNRTTKFWNYLLKYQQTRIITIIP